MDEIKTHCIPMNPQMALQTFKRIKTCTRRPIVPQPAKGLHIGKYYDSDPRNDEWVLLDKHGDGIDAPEIKCPYGKVGDILKIREAWATMKVCDNVAPRHLPVNSPIWYCDTDVDEPTGCGDDKGKNRPSLFMPKWACRTTRVICGIDVQRIQDITEEEAKAEGVEKAYLTDQGYVLQHEQGNYKQGFEFLWDYLYGNTVYVWKNNPFVWVIRYV